MIATVEYRVRPVTRWVVTRYEETERTGQSEVIGEFDNELNAHCVRAAMTNSEKEEHDTMGDGLGHEVTDQARQASSYPFAAGSFSFRQEAANQRINP